MAATAAPFGPGPGMPGYPVRITIDRNQEINRLWGIPLLGLVARWILLIPHFLILWVLGVIIGLSILVTWIPILFTGRFPGWAIDLYELTYRWSLRVAGYATLMTSDYPPFSADAPYAIDLTIDTGRTINRLWGIPFLGVWLRGILVIPHVIFLAVLGVGVFLAMWVVWIPVLVNGRFPQLGYDLFGIYLRISTRVSIYTLMVPVPYPPIASTE